MLEFCILSLRALLIFGIVIPPLPESVEEMSTEATSPRAPNKAPPPKILADVPKALPKTDLKKPWSKPSTLAISA